MGGDANNAIAWQLGTAERIPLHFVPEKLAFKSFLECWNAKAADGGKPGLKEFMTTKGKEGVKDIDAALNFFGKIEDELETCSGACAVPLFGVKKPIADGPV